MLAPFCVSKKLVIVPIPKKKLLPYKYIKKNNLKKVKMKKRNNTIELNKYVKNYLSKPKAKAKNTSSSKFCAFCKNIGRPESEYFSHFTRQSKDPKSAITCPELLSIQCKHCHGFGHKSKDCFNRRKKGNVVREANIVEVKEDNDAKDMDSYFCEIMNKKNEWFKNIC
jgi:hypothetical protein